MCPTELSFSRQHKISDIMHQSCAKHPFAVYLCLFPLLFWTSLSVLPLLTPVLCTAHMASNVYFSYSFYSDIKLSYHHYGLTRECQMGRHMNHFMEDMHQQLVCIRNIAIMSSLSSLITVASWCSVVLCASVRLLPFTLTLNCSLLFCMLTKNRILTSYILRCKWRHFCPLFEAPLVELRRHRASKQWIKDNIRSGNETRSPPVIRHDLKTLVVPTSTDPEGEHKENEENKCTEQDRGHEVADPDTAPPATATVTAFAFEVMISDFLEKMRQSGYQQALLHDLHSLIGGSNEKLMVALEAEREQMCGSLPPLIH